MLVQMLMQVIGDGGVRDITSLISDESHKEHGLGFVWIPHVKVLHFFHGL